LIMSAQGLQHVVCRGSIDRSFFSELSRSPQQALAGFDLDADEWELIVRLAPRTLTELAIGVEDWRRGAAAVPSTPTRALAHV